MIERIQQIMEYEDIKPGEFAEKIGINRSAISHILNQRNKPSLDVINRILIRYNYIDTDWLIFGKGSMFKPENEFEKANQVNQSRHQPSLFDQDYMANKTLLTEKTVDEQQVKITDIPSPSLSLGELQEVRIPVAKKITKLVIFYSDNTFDTFAPDKGIF